jgi:RHS repeat-associated protein
MGRTGGWLGSRTRGRAGATKFYYTKDHLGSIREVLGANGTVVSSSRYDAWGVRTTQGAQDAASFGFTGHLEQKELGLVFTLYRAYDPATGRWLSRDPFASIQSQMNAAMFGTTAADYYARGIFMPEMLPGGPNLYSYVGNNPVNLTDPDGEIWPLVLGGVAAYFVVNKATKAIVGGIAYNSLYQQANDYKQAVCRTSEYYGGYENIPPEIMQTLNNWRGSIASGSGENIKQILNGVPGQSFYGPAGNPRPGY